MNKVPLRLRITVAFAVAMSVVLEAVGLFVYLQLEAELDQSIEQSLRSRAGDVAALVRGSQGRLGDSAAASLVEQDESFAQILRPGGRIVDSTPQVRARALLGADEVEAAATEPRFFERDRVPGLEGPVRLLAAPVDADPGRMVAVVGSSLDDRDEALSSLATLLLIGGPVALVLASLAGYAAAAAALRPVETLRRQAAAISASRLDERLPVPIARDELRRLGETLNAMLSRLEAALKRERRFVDNASHELRTPLTLQKTELELALRHATDPQELRTAIESAIQEVDRLIQLAEDLLVVARSGQGEPALADETFAAEELLAAVGERFRAQAAGSGREVEVAANRQAVRGDRGRIEQALTCMVDNALRHGEGSIRIWAVTTPGRVELHVTDRGPGFAPKFLDRAFERFSRADAARTRGGAGLGLAIVDSIARAHGGRAAAANDPHGGADVWIELPD